LLFTITGKHMTVSEAVKKHAQEKTSKLGRYYDRINRVEVILDGDTEGQVNVEIIARAGHNKTFVVKESDQNTFRCIDLAVRKLEAQLRKVKGKEHDDKRGDT